ncbi:hypothetical protein SAMN04488074_12864 [Lentzea albidocapillata subsp. violacea]|uniref:DUF2637 domain-containing protein n=1 Tax=Lentzea albidocapillata subsp. violacea TaxID=128104 RepID=A0A1G9WSE7_9PSEU|nr:hypothetical protein [Lentzea albidocapillata]SDM87367.1 hypothetical protein SAMN04488074_12864 [Lentzea albidocapillata subsp. violacea]
MASSGHISVTGTDVVVRAVTVIMGTVVGLTFLFGFGNVLSLGLRLGVPIWVAPLVAPAVDLSILGLLLAIRHLALAGASDEVLRPARRLLMFASAVTLALNVADPVVADEYGKAAFDAVGPLLLIGWAEVGPRVLQAIKVAAPSIDAGCAGVDCQRNQLEEAEERGSQLNEVERVEPGPEQPRARATHGYPIEAYLDRARVEDADHRALHQKPISADNLRARLRIGAAPARQLVKIVRDEFDEQVRSRISEVGAAIEALDFSRENLQLRRRERV